MTNAFLNTDLLVRDAAILLADNMVAMETVNRAHEQVFANKIGEAVRVDVPVMFTARDLFVDGTTTADDMAVESVSLRISAQPYIRRDLTSREKSFNLDDFTAKVTTPAIMALRDKIDNLMIHQMVAGFAPYLVGTDGNSPTTIAHLVAGRKRLQDNGAPLADRFGMLDTTAEAALLQLAQFQSSDYGAEANAGLKEAILGRRFGINWMTDQNCGTQTAGSVAGTVHVNDGGGALQIGDTEVNINDFDVATGTIYAGQRLTFAGDATVYTVTADVVKAANAATIAITPPLVAAPANDAVVTFKTAPKQNLIYCKNAVAGCVVAPAPLAANSSVVYYNGYGIRVSVFTAVGPMSDSIVYDTFFAGKVIQPKAGCVLQG